MADTDRNKGSFSMGKSVELLGLAAFNVFLALILSIMFLSQADSNAITELTDAHVETFIQEVSDISSGQREDMDAYGVTSYFMEHLAEDSSFKTTLEYDIPDIPSGERVMEMDKLNFISHVLQGLQSMTRHETLVRIENITIDEEGKNAFVLTTNYERGVMPVSNGNGDVSMIPVVGTSYCEQKIILAEKQNIQMAQANCNTSISFTDIY